ncbi:von Willebrand factor A domain-containing protein 8 [Phytophthora pseudosyringae]|uniref:von Willebrand factor A domain-containing protein 8 n=1 Tax=Phytophthora pseudosyringae TaxID=221518 RepID=A0A8T1V7A5_9STRA|nr:von Willebrand factor A domain-containing protein 8 [Phytophthora pseudosyringae]
MTPDVTDGKECGPEALLEYWKLFSLCFNDVCVELESLETGALVGSLVASVTVRMTISSEILRRVFPHLNSDGQGGVGGGKWSPLVGSLLGRRLVVRGSVLFDWDNKTRGF